MISPIIAEIMSKLAALSETQQREVLTFVEAKVQQANVMNHDAAAETKKPFRSVRGILKRPLNHLEEDLQTVRREMWANFPRTNL